MPAGCEHSEDINRFIPLYTARSKIFTQDILQFIKSAQSPPSSTHGAGYGQAEISYLEGSGLALPSATARGVTGASTHAADLKENVCQQSTADGIA